MKTNKLSILFIIISMLLSLGSYAFVEWDQTSAGYQNHMESLLYPALFALFMFILFIIVLSKKEKGAIVPLLGFVATGIYFVNKLATITEFNPTILDVVSPSNNASVLTFLLFIGFIVCAFASIFKGCKYTNLYVAGYFVLLALTTISFLPNITTKEFMMFYTLNSWSMVLGYISFMILFFGAKKEEKKPEENKEETKEITE